MRSGFSSLNVAIMLLAIVECAVVFGGLEIAPRLPPHVADLPAPVRLSIPSQGISAPIELVGVTADGAMGIPESAYTVGWYKHGTAPGGTGSAVFAGHRDTAYGTPGVFWDLENVQVGDALVVDTASGTQLHFVVRRTAHYPFDQSPMQEIFGSFSGRYLNLITCAGIWKRQTYDTRLVVYSELATPL